MPIAFKAIGQPKRKIKTLEKIYLLTPFLLIHLVKNINLLPTRSMKRTKTIKEVFGTIVNKDIIVTKIPL